MSQPSKNPTRGGEKFAQNEAHSSLEDEHVRLLDASGALKNVVGSQSVLSQEIMDLSQREPTSEASLNEAVLFAREELGAGPSNSSDSPQESKPKSLSQVSQISFLMDAAQVIENVENAAASSQESAKLGSSGQKNSSSKTATMQEKPVTRSSSGKSTTRVSKSGSVSRKTNRLGTSSRVPSRSARNCVDQHTVRTTNRRLSRSQVPPAALSRPSCLAHFPSNVVESIAPSASSKRKASTMAATAVTAVSTTTTTPDGIASSGQRNPPIKKSTAASNLKSNKDGPIISLKRRKANKEGDMSQTHELAQQAAELAAQIISSPHVAKQLLLTMALVRINPRAAPETWPSKGSLIEEGFFWGTYPPLETVLRAHMRTYYDLSTRMCQSKDQQQFNNDLTVKVRAEAEKYGWFFSPNFTDKVLRDRIRCFFKTHIQNSKKRLRTLIKNPTKRANAKALCDHLQLIQKYSTMEADPDEENFFGEEFAAMKTTMSYKHMTNEPEDSTVLPAPRKNEVQQVQDKEDKQAADELAAAVAISGMMTNESSSSPAESPIPSPLPPPDNQPPESQLPDSLPHSLPNSFPHSLGDSLPVSIPDSLPPDSFPNPSSQTAQISVYGLSQLTQETEPTAV